MDILSSNNELLDIELEVKHMGFEDLDAPCGEGGAFDLRACQGGALGSEIGKLRDRKQCQR
ncbi:hypothetical protein MD484_g7412, partial [Candolleomyces efflorescens]